MRVTIRLDDELAEDTSEMVRGACRSLSAVIEEALRQHLAQQHAPGKGERARLETVKGQGLFPGVDLDDSAALLELMERDDGFL